MNARVALQAALLARVRTVEGLGAFDAPPVRGGVPYGVVEEPVLTASDAAGLDGRVGTIAVTYRDDGERPVRLRRLIGEVEDAIAAMPRVVEGGWYVVGLRLARSRLSLGRNIGWVGTSEFAVRMFRLQS